MTDLLNPPTTATSKTKQIKRLFNIAALLLEKPQRASQIQAKIGCAQRTVHRDLRMLVRLGFDINTDFRCRYYITTEGRPEFIKKLL